MLVFFILIIFGFFFVTKQERFDVGNNSYKIWETDENIIFNNCYAYAFTDIDSSRTTKPQPGYKKNLSPLSRNQFTCNEIIKRVLLDFPDANFLGNTPKINSLQCKEGFHMVFLVIDNEDENRDYHFYRRNKRGFWTHKPGSYKIYYVDGSNDVITNPYYANHHYREFQYNTPCGFFCVKTNL
jgi:hypothetical protein